MSILWGRWIIINIPILYLRNKSKLRPSYLSKVTKLILREPTGETALEGSLWKTAFALPPRSDIWEAVMLGQAQGCAEKAGEEGCCQVGKWLLAACPMRRLMERRQCECGLVGKGSDHLQATQLPAWILHKPVAWTVGLPGRRTHCKVLCFSHFFKLRYD